jgi:hypothetical protein
MRMVSVQIVKVLTAKFKPLDIHSIIASLELYGIRELLVINVKMEARGLFENDSRC